MNKSNSQYEVASFRPDKPNMAFIRRHMRRVVNRQNKSKFFNRVFGRGREVEERQFKS